MSWTLEQLIALQSKRGEKINIVAAPVAELEPELVVRDSTDIEKLNKLERAWLSEMRSRGYGFIGVQSVTLKLGHDCRYTPDFTAVVDGVRCAFETKGFMRDDAQVKLRVAAREFRWLFAFHLVTRQNGAWKVELVKP